MFQTESFLLFVFLSKLLQSNSYNLCFFLFEGIVTPVAPAGQTTFKLEATYDKYRSAKSNAYKNRQAMRGRDVGERRR